MKRYYRCVTELSRLNEMLLALFRETIAPATRAARKRGRSTPASRPSIGLLEVANSPAFPPRHPVALLELFLVLQQRPEVKGVRASTIRLVRRSSTPHRRRVSVRPAGLRDLSGDPAPAAPCRPRTAPHAPIRTAGGGICPSSASWPGGCSTTSFTRTPWTSTVSSWSPACVPSRYRRGAASSPCARLSSRSCQIRSCCTLPASFTTSARGRKAITPRSERVALARFATGMDSTPTTRTSSSGWSGIIC